MTKKYSVVEFTEEENCVAVVPTSWLVDQSMCYWPSQFSQPKIKKAVYNCVEADALWTTCLVNVLYETDDYIEARQKSKQAEEHTDVQSEYEERMERKNRKRRIPTRLLDSDTSEEDIPEPPPENLIVPPPTRRRKGSDLPNTDLSLTNQPSTSRWIDGKSTPVRASVPKNSRSQVHVSPSPSPREKSAYASLSPNHDQCSISGTDALTFPSPYHRRNNDQCSVSGTGATFPSPYHRRNNDQCSVSGTGATFPSPYHMRNNDQCSISGTDALTFPSPYHRQNQVHQPDSDSSPIEKLRKELTAFYGKMFAFNEDVKLRMSEINRKMDILVATSNNFASAKQASVEWPSTFPAIPFDELQKLQEFDGLLEVKNNTRLAVSYLSIIKGRDAGETTRLILNTLLSRSLQRSLNWAGVNRAKAKTTKYGLKQLSRFTSLIMRVVSNSRENVNIQDVKAHIQNTLKHAPDRTQEAD